MILHCQVAHDLMERSLSSLFLQAYYHELPTQGRIFCILLPFHFFNYKQKEKEKKKKNKIKKKLTVLSDVFLKAKCFRIEL